MSWVPAFANLPSIGIIQLSPFGFQEFVGWHTFMSSSSLLLKFTRSLVLSSELFHSSLTLSHSDHLQATITDGFYSIFAIYKSFTVCAWLICSFLALSGLIPASHCIQFCKLFHILVINHIVENRSSISVGRAKTGRWRTDGQQDTFWWEPEKGIQDHSPCQGSGKNKQSSVDQKQTNHWWWWAWGQQEMHHGPTPQA